MTAPAPARGPAATVAAIALAALALAAFVAFVARGREATPPAPGPAGDAAGVTSAGDGRSADGAAAAPARASAPAQQRGEATPGGANEQGRAEGAFADGAGERGRAEGAFADGANERGRAEGAFAEADGAPAANDEPATSRPGFGEASAPGAEPPALASRASAAKPKAPPTLTDPLRIEAGKLPGPTLKPASPGGAATSREGPAPRSPAIALYNEAERALIAGRGQDCLSLLERADATPGGPELREREQRAASPVVRAQCTMLLGRCDEGTTRLRAAGWPNAAVEGARARFCAP